jgi:hypothetical protein
MKNIIAPENLPATASCTRCKGSGENFFQGFTAEDGKVYPDRFRKCYACDGKGIFSKPIEKDILEALKGRNGMRSAKPKDNKEAAYVWRMARFHGGKDLTMPVCAMSDIAGNPYGEYLDQIADRAAKMFFGSDLAAAKVWGRALGMI